MHASFFSKTSCVTGDMSSPTRFSHDFPTQRNAEQIKSCHDDPKDS